MANNFRRNKIGPGIIKVGQVEFRLIINKDRVQEKEIYYINLKKIINKLFNYQNY